MGNNWSIKDAYKRYLLDRWGDGIFDINTSGHVIIRPDNDAHEIDLMSVVNEIDAKGITFPVVIRFHNILRNKVIQLNETFNEVIAETGFKGEYCGVFPIKVNQMREVVEEIVEAGAAYNYGLEAGSKAELSAVLAYNKNPESLTILNGYKDNDYLRLALLGNKIGRKFIVTIEQFSEIERLIKLSQEIDVQPMIGLRIKLSIEGMGRWSHSSGDRAKFGLTITEILKCVKLLEQHQMLDALRLLHFHMGSQISDINVIKDAIVEAARTYSQLVKLGAAIEYFDVGGGLGVDYDGTQSNSESSKNYTLGEYVSNIIGVLKRVCDIEEVAHPNIVTESGRAITAHHSCIITNVIGEIDPLESKDRLDDQDVQGELIISMRHLLDSCNEDNLQPTYNAARQLRKECLQSFNLGSLSIEDRAAVETLYWRVLDRINQHLEGNDSAPEGLRIITKNLSSQYLCNFSLFQSAADMWAINQVLPIMPITRLDEEPVKMCILADITCDSDGKIDHFVGRSEAAETLFLHELNEGEEYFIGVFLTGAYQDVMGDMHNLFGRLNEVHVFGDSSDSNGFYIEEVIPGNTVSNVLSTMQYFPDQMVRNVKELVDQEITRGNLSPREGVLLVDFYEDCLSGSTYLKKT